MIIKGSQACPQKTLMKKSSEGIKNLRIPSGGCYDKEVANKVKKLTSLPN
jgi:hypothetical protein